MNRKPVTFLVLAAVIAAVCAPFLGDGGISIGDRDSSQSTRSLIQQENAATAVADVLEEAPDPEPVIRSVKQDPPTEPIHTASSTPPSNTPPADNNEGPFSISGLVVDEAGYPVRGVELTADAMTRFEDGGGKRSGRSSFSSLTDGDGLYEMAGLADGEYTIRSPATDAYRAAQITARAGSETADLVLRSHVAPIRVFGTVRSGGQPLDSVSVAVIGQAKAVGTSDFDGRYELDLLPQVRRIGHTLRFEREGFREHREVIPATELDLRNTVRLDVELEPARELVQASGVVSDPQGEAIPGQPVQLYSASTLQRYSTSSGHGGLFRFEEVEAADDYTLSILPDEHWRDFTRHDVEIGLDSAPLNVVLEPLALGSLSGQMVDPAGKPVPAFSLWLRNPGAVNQPTFLVTGDQQGFFQLDRVTAGSLIFESRSSPLYHISGIDLAGQEEKNVNLVLDHGTHRVAGLVMDEAGVPVPASELVVTSIRHDGGLRSQAVRRAVSDETGYFLFTRVGPGYHTIRVQVPGFQTEVIDHEVGGDDHHVIIRLERASSHGM